MTTAAMAVAVAEALAKANGEKSARSAQSTPKRSFGDLRLEWAARARVVAVWAAVLAASAMTGLVLAWVYGRIWAGHGGR